MSARFHIGGREVGDGCPALVIAEAGLAHDGSLGTAHAFIEVAARAGCDAVKFQTHIAEAESTAREPFRVKFSRQDATRFDYWHRTSFTEPQWRELSRHAAEAGLIFLSSPFSDEAVALLDGLGMPAWKIASGEVGNTVLLDRILQTGKPVLLSSGMSDWSELDAAAQRVRTAGVPLMLFQCTTRYPCPPEHVGLRVLARMRERFGVPVGLSDHSGRGCFGVAAVALGAAAVEVHMTMSRESFGPDVPASLTPGELAQLVADIRAIEADLRGEPDKDRVAATMAPLREIFTRSIVARGALPRGHVLSGSDLACKKPAGGLPPSALPQLVGKTLTRDLPADALIQFEDLA